jgi:hypothetical protein
MPPPRAVAACGRLLGWLASAFPQAQARGLAPQRCRLFRAGGHKSFSQPLHVQLASRCNANYTVARTLLQSLVLKQPSGTHRPAISMRACRHVLAGVEEADSFAWNAHKMMGVPLSCAAFMTRHKGESLSWSRPRAGEQQTGSGLVYWPDCDHT